MKKYDIVILGGGIAGLYTSYQLLKRFPSKTKRILLVEKENNVGGRVETYKTASMTVEAGAGRFHMKQTILIHLLKELNLFEKAIPIKTGNMYYDIHKQEPQENPCYTIIEKIVYHSKRDSIEKLRTITLLNYIHMVLSFEEMQIVKDSFGYYSELVVMNAYDAIQLIERHLSTDIQFMVLRGGLSQIIRELKKRILEMGGEIRTKMVVKNIIKDTTTQNQGFWVNIEKNNMSKTKKQTMKKQKQYQLYTNQLVVALPKQAVEKIPFFKPLKSNLSHILCEPLCRIYSVFPKNKSTGKTWFHDIPKFNTNNDLRMVIPIDPEKGIIMTSYTDYVFAKKWKRLYDSRGYSGVNKELVRLLHESLGDDIEIPEPKVTEMFYWGCGVGYWGLGINSDELSTKLSRPFGDSLDIFFCGEQYSARNQQWMEGALETSNRIIPFLAA